jgi:hypothetical protein
MSMARLWRDQGKRDEARELLAPVYGWFTEGFDTLDLMEPRRCLTRHEGAQALGYEPSRRSVTKLLTKDEARRMASSAISERRLTAAPSFPTCAL